MHKITILLTEHTDFLATVFKWITYSIYSHVSLEIEEESGEYFSFVTTNGFKAERPLLTQKEWKKKQKCATFQATIDSEIYQLLLAHIKEFQQNQEQYRYSFIGVLCCMFHIPLKRERRYFCSEFVSELLMKSGVLKTGVCSTTFLPDYFMREQPFTIQFEGTIGELIKQKQQERSYSFKKRKEVFR